MTPHDFRKLALQLPDVVESAHVGHPDFRVRGRVFATLGYPSDEFATIMLPPTEQAEIIKEDSRAFAPAKGAWGLRGSTTVHLKFADSKLVKKALSAAWAHKSSAPARSPRTRSSGRAR